MKVKESNADSRSGISNRADLIQALTVASQLEHGLMLMYLYAAFSMKAFPEELITDADRKLPKDSPEAKARAQQREVERNQLRNWEANILRIARQEMEHLGFVCNLLSVIGGNQYFDRPNFPQPPKYWDVKLPIELERFNIDTLLRFLAYEKPQNLDDPELDDYRDRYYPQPPTMLKMGASPQPLEPVYTSLGDLYDQIRTAFKTMPEEELFIVPPTAQVDNDTLFGAGANARPIYNIFLFKTWDRQSAINAIDEIIEQGEGTLLSSKVTIENLDPTCHYMLFRQTLKDYTNNFTLLKPVFEGARDCVRNPAFELHQDTITRIAWTGEGKLQPPMSVAIINHQWTRTMLGVSNTAYESLMQMLVRLYTAVDDTSTEVSGIVNTVFFPMMTMVIRPLSELLSLLPAFALLPELPAPKGGKSVAQAKAEHEERAAENLRVAAYTAGAGFEYFRTIGFLPHKPAAWITIHERLQQNADNYAAAYATMPAEIKARLVALGYQPDVAMKFIGQNLARIASNFKSYMNV